MTTGSFPHDNFSSVYWIFNKLGHMITLWKGKNPIYFGVITIIPFDNLFWRAYFVMHKFLVYTALVCLEYIRSWFQALLGSNQRLWNWYVLLHCQTHSIKVRVKKSPGPTPGASNFHIWVSWNNQLYARLARLGVNYIQM